MKVILEVHENDNMEPSRYGYDGGFSNLNQCMDCNIVGLSGDMHVVDACVKCGGRVTNYKPGKWNKKLGAWEIRQGIEK